MSSGEMDSECDGISGECSVERLMSVTAIDRTQAESLLAAASGNVERAVNLFFESVSSPAVSADRPTTSKHPDDGAAEEEPVRAPIRPRADVLLDAADMTVNYAQSDERRTRHRRRMWRSHSVLDKFRDFSAEIQLQERQCGSRTADDASSSAAKRRTLEEMFRPPLHLLCGGSFETARACGVSRKHWLLVNVQKTTEFACQVLNRDVWSQPAVEQLVRRSFVLWQVYDGSGEGRRYCTFYPVSRWPYVAALDPRTGQLLQVWHLLDAENAVQALSDFLDQNRYDEDCGENCRETKRARIITANDLDEDAQMKLAIERSLRSNAGHKRNGNTSSHDDDLGANSSSGDDDDYERDMSSSERVKSQSLVDAGDRASGGEDDPPTTKSDSSSDTAIEASLIPSSSSTSVPSASVDDTAPEHKNSAVSEQWRQYLGTASDVQWTLALRLPDSRRVRLQLPRSSLVRCVALYAEHLGFPAGLHELVTTYPRRRLSSEELLDVTLEQAGLRSHDTLFVQSL